MRVSVRLATVLVVAFFLGSCNLGPGRIGVRLEKMPRFDWEWGRYLEIPGCKSLAVAGNPEGVYVSGVASESESLEEAIGEALALCDARRADRGVDEVCQIYAVGDRPVAAGRAWRNRSSRVDGTRG